MPALTIHTNIHLEGMDTDQLLRELTTLVAEGLGKDEEWVMVRLEANSRLFMAGSDDPAALVEILSMDLPEDAPLNMTRRICAYLDEKLNVPPRRVYVDFPMVAGTHFGWNHQTLR